MGDVIFGRPLKSFFLQQDFPLIYVQEKKYIQTFHIENDYLLFTTLFSKIYYFFLCILRVRTNIFLNCSMYCMVKKLNNKKTGGDIEMKSLTLT